MHRFHVPPIPAHAVQITLPDHAADQVRKVLRMRAGDTVTVFDGSGAERDATLVEVTQRKVTVGLGTPRFPRIEPELSLTVCQALIRPERFELVLEKCTELGASSFIPIKTGRVQSADSAGPSLQRMTRWRRIVEEAAEQSGRTSVPELAPPQQLAAAVEQQLVRGPVVLLWEAETSSSLAGLLRRMPPPGPPALSLIVGPVGGLTREEVHEAVRMGATTASIGPRVLRSETTAIVSVALALSELGHMAPPVPSPEPEGDRDSSLRQESEGEGEA